MTINPISLNIDASTHCQLECASCPTGRGLVKENIGAGHLKARDLEAFLDKNRSVLHVELANWGEVFLNPELEEIAKIAYERSVALTAFNGVNFNHASPALLEALVKYRVQFITAAIDGASQEAYAKYRIKGDLARVLDNIRLLNGFKQKHRSYFPVLVWQFIAFGHNEHEIEDARARATSLGMHFYVKLAWHDFSPVKNKPLIRAVAKGGAASREEFLRVHGEAYLQKALCRQVWNNPQINFNGEVLGCCANYWVTFGNAFRNGLSQVLGSEKMRYVKQMLMGRVDPRENTPCIHCELFHSMQERGDFMRPEDLTDPVRKYLGYAPVRRVGKTLVWSLNRSRRLTHWVVRPLAEVVIRRTVDS